MAMRREIDPTTASCRPIWRGCSESNCERAYFTKAVGCVARRQHPPAGAGARPRPAERQHRRGQDAAAEGTCASHRRQIAALPAVAGASSRSAFATDRFMTFHLPVSAEVLENFPSAELLLGKPMPVDAASACLKSGVLASRRRSRALLADRYRGAAGGIWRARRRTRHRSALLLRGRCRSAPRRLRDPDALIRALPADRFPEAEMPGHHGL